MRRPLRSSGTTMACWLLTSRACACCLRACTGFPGAQQAVAAEQFCVRDNCYDHMLTYEDVALESTVSPDQTQYAGGYTVRLLNTTTACEQVGCGWLAGWFAAPAGAGMLACLHAASVAQPGKACWAAALLLG